MRKVFVVLLFAACQIHAPVAEWGDCSSACARMLELDCEAAQTTARGATCEEVCENAFASEYARWNVGCMTVAPDCQAADTCE